MILYILIIILGVAIDQLTKLYALHSLTAVTTVPIIPNVFHLTYIENDGAAFSIFSGQQFFLIFITLIAIVAIAALLVFIPKNKKFIAANVSLSMILAGAIGNLIDRLRFSYVVDFFDFRLIGFAIFNVADVLVVVGCCLLVLTILRNRFPSKKQQLRVPHRKQPTTEKNTKTTSSSLKKQTKTISPKKTGTKKPVSKPRPQSGDNHKSVSFTPTPPKD